MSASPHLSTPRVLIAETSASMAVALKMMLASEGVAVEVASSFEAASQAIARAVFDVVLTAPLQRPAIGGDLFSLAAELRRRASPTPVGVMTGHLVDPNEVATRGFAFFLPKPFSGEELLGAVARAAGRQLDEASRPEVGLIRRYFAALGERDWDALAALCDASVVYHLPPPGPFGRTVAGRDAFRAFAAETFARFPEAAFHDVAVYELGEGLVARYRSRWQGPDGAPREQAGTVVFHVADGCVTRIGVELDQDLLAQQAGELGE